MANRKRNIQIKFYVTEDEKRLIDEKMSQLPTRRYGAYLRKMAIDGYLIQMDLSDVKEAVRLLGITSANMNQYAKKANETGSIYKEDIDDIRLHQEELWKVMKEILKRLSTI